jgi:hypothetical protein
MKQAICIFNLICIFLTIFIGCSRDPFYKKKAERVIDLKKKIGIVAFDNREKMITPANIDYFYTQIVSQMTQLDQSLFFVTDGIKPEVLKTTSRLLSNDHIDRQSLIETARKKGYQALIWARIHDLEIIFKNAGIIGFRKKMPFIQFRGEFSLFDCETHTKLWYSNLEDAYRLDKLFDDNEVKQTVLNEISIKKELVYLSKIIASQMVDVLKKDPWKCFIIESSNDLYILSSGLKAGVVNHMMLDVIGSMGTINGIYNQKYLVPGKPIGRIQIVEVNENISKGVALYGNQLEKSICAKYSNPR